ncbi:MAG: site-2 protease family protein [Nanoarchaeota archaeon]|nr:site-2 protease family protein [Nanoarchaeota archaeon]
MNFDLLFAVLFYGLIFWFFVKYRQRWQVQGIIAIYRTKLGVKLMHKIAQKVPWLLRWLSGISVLIGFAGMAMILYYLVVGTFLLITVPSAAPAVAPVLPGVKVPGLPDLSFWHWVVSIFIVAAVHEFFHGVYAFLYKIPVKSSGLALFGPILGAFVEPDDKVMKKKSRFHQITVFSAGPFANVLLAILALVVLNLVVSPLYGSMFEGSSIQVNTIIPGHAVEQSGLTAPFFLYSLNNISTNSIPNFLNATNDIRAGQQVLLNTSQGVYTVVAESNKNNVSRGFMGIADFEMQIRVKPVVEAKWGSFVPKVVGWLHMLMFWLFIVSFGVGLFNLLPLGPIDGGRMFLVGLGYVVKSESKQKKIFGAVTLFCLLLILINLLPYLWKLLVWIASPFLGS